MTYTYTTTNTFTRTSAQYIASKVVADLRAMNTYYGRPSESQIWEYYGELVELLLGGYVSNIEYGFKLNNQRVVSLYYEVRSDGSLTDGKSGGVYARADVADARWFSYLNYSWKWSELTDGQREQIEARLPIQRTTSPAPEDGNGYWVMDRSYHSDGVGTQRRTFRPN